VGCGVGGWVGGCVCLCVCVCVCVCVCEELVGIIEEKIAVKQCKQHVREM